MIYILVEYTAVRGYEQSRSIFASSSKEKVEAKQKTYSAQAALAQKLYGESYITIHQWEAANPRPGGKFDSPKGRVWWERHTKFIAETHTALEKKNSLRIGTLSVNSQFSYYIEEVESE